MRRRCPAAPTRLLGFRNAALSTTALLVVAPIVALAPPASAADDDGLVLHYEFSADDLHEGVVTDRSSRHLDGIIVNAGSASVVDGHTTGEQALHLSGGAASSSDAPYVRIPNGLFQDVHETTISAWVKWDGGADFQWLYGLGKDKDDTTFLTPSFEGDQRARSSVKPVEGRGEVGVSSDAKLPAGEWVNVTSVLDGTTLRFFIDGQFVGSTEAKIDPATTLYDASKTTSGFLGQPFWTGVHPFFAGAIDDFRVYDRALNSTEVAALAGTTVPTPTSLAQTSFEARTTEGTAPVLPGSVEATYGDGSTKDVPIDWDDIDPASYQQRGTFTVRGTAGGLPVTASVYVARANEMTIDLSQSTGAFMGGASGTLYGLYGEGVPSNNLIEGMNLRTVATKAQDGINHPGADALEVVKPLVDSTGGDVYIYMPDIYRGFPYQWPGDTLAERMADYEPKVATQVDQVLTLPAEYRDHIVFVPFNEPEGNMFGGWLDNPTDFYNAWDTIYKLIKDRMPGARVAGPNTGMLHDGNKGFLQHTADAGTVPDVMTWHELNGPSLKRSVATYRGWEDEILGGKHLPINIDEFAWNYHISAPGLMIQWFSAIEDSKVDADMSYWNIDGNLSDSAVQSNRANGQWWTLNAYSQMSGNTVDVSVPDPDALYTLRGVATLDASKKQARALFGGASGSSSVTFTHVDPAVFGDTAHALVQRIDWSGQIGESAGPVTVEELDLPVTDGSVTFDFGDSLPALTETSVYQIILSPGAHAQESSAPTELWKGTYEAEDSTLTGGYAIYDQGSPSDLGKPFTSGGKDVGGLKTGSDVTMTYTVDVPQDGTYDLSVFANTSYKSDMLSDVGKANFFLTVDGSAEQELLVPLGYKWEAWDHVDTTVTLTAGQHSIRVSGKSLDGTKSMVGDSVFDKIDLTLPNPAATPRVYEAENATLENGATPRYDQDGASGSGVVSVPAGGSATFWVHSEDEEGSTVFVDTFGGGTGTLWVNDQNVGTVSGSAPHQVFLQGGINKVVVTGDQGELALDRVRVQEGGTDLVGTVYQAEDATTGGTASVATFPLAEGGKGVTGIGGAPDNDNTLTFPEVTVERDGRYALTFRYSNDEFSNATHYNPDPLARRYDMSVNGSATVPVLFPVTFHRDNFFEKTVFVDLKAGANTISFRSQEQPNFDGKTLLSTTYTEAVLRSQWGPDLDRITVTPITEAAVAPEPLAAITLSSPSAAAGGKVTVSGTGFAEGDTVALSLHSNPIDLGSATAAEDGTFTAEVTIPADAPTGAHRIVATASPSGRTAEAAITITANGDGGSGNGGSGTAGSGTGATGSGATGSSSPRGGLASTGTDIGIAPALALLLLGAGAIAFAARRVRRRRP